MAPAIDASPKNQELGEDAVGAIPATIGLAEGPPGTAPGFVRLREYFELLDGLLGGDRRCSRIRS